MQWSVLEVQCIMWINRICKSHILITCFIFGGGRAWHRMSYGCIIYNEPDAIDCEHLPTQISYDYKLQSGRDPDEDVWFPETFSDSLCRNSLVMQTDCCSSCPGGCLRWSKRWRCWMWRSWPGVVTHGLRFWGRLDVLPNSLKRLDWSGDGLW